MAAWIMVGVVAAAGLIFLLQPSAKPSAPANAGAATRPPTTESATPAAKAKSVAVLPFENLSADKEHAYFADGMHDEVITALSKIRDLTVISRPSVMSYRSTEGRNLPRIAGELGVANFLVGSVQRAGSRVKASVQLLDARRGALLWGEPFTEDVTDAFAIQAKIAGAITTALRATFAPAEQALLARRPTDNQRAYELYLRARQMNIELTSAAARERWEEALRVLDEAIALDPRFVQALAQRALLHQRMYWFGNVDPTPAWFALGQSALAALKAVAPDAPETAFIEGYFVLNRNLDWAQALRHHETALRGLPNDTFVLRLTGWARFNLGKFDEGIADGRRGQALDPTDVQTATNLAVMTFMLRRFEACLTTGGPLAGRIVQTYGNGGDTIARARFEVDGDRDALARNLSALAAGSPRGQMQAAHESALVRGDLARAASCLAEDPAGAVTWQGAMVEPASLNQALIARLVGRRDVAAAYAEKATSLLRAGVKSYRQENFARVMLIRAAGYGGHDDEAVRLAKAAQQELTPARIGFADAATILSELGRLYALLGAREEAFACLRALTSGPASPAGFGTPRLMRIDPCWSRLKDDPRFEEMLRAAKTL